MRILHTAYNTDHQVVELLCSDNTEYAIQYFRLNRSTDSFTVIQGDGNCLYILFSGVTVFYQMLFRIFHQIIIVCFDLITQVLRHDNNHPHRIVLYSIGNFVLRQVLDKLLPGFIMKKYVFEHNDQPGCFWEKGFDVFAVTQAWTLLKKYQIQQKSDTRER